MGGWKEGREGGRKEGETGEERRGLLNERRGEEGDRWGRVG